MSDFIFKKVETGLEFVGDFDSLYSAEEDPWGQSGTSRSEYSRSRSTQVAILVRNCGNGKLLDIGCGLGVTTKMFSSHYAASGMDISAVAIEKAQQRYPELAFFVGDISAGDFSHNEKYDVVVLNLLLWYVINDFDQVLENLKKVAADGAVILVSSFLLDEQEQQYGREHFKGHTEVVQWLASRAKPHGMTLQEYECARLDSVFDFHGLLRAR